MPASAQSLRCRDEIPLHRRRRDDLSHKENVGRSDPYGQSALRSQRLPTTYDNNRSSHRRRHLADCHITIGDRTPSRAARVQQPREQRANTAID